MMHTREACLLIGRYLLLILIPLGNMALLSAVLAPLTIAASFWCIQAMYGSAMLLGTNTIFFKGYYASIISACVAITAYYLLIVLNLTTPMSLKKRLCSLVFSLGLFFALNVTRITVFARLFERGYDYFSLAHELTWYFGSTVLVILVWFVTVFVCQIKDIPLYTDVSTLLTEIRGKG